VAAEDANAARAIRGKVAGQDKANGVEMPWMRCIRYGLLDLNHRFSSCFGRYRISAIAIHWRAISIALAKGIQKPWSIDLKRIAIVEILYPFS